MAVPLKPAGMQADVGAGDTSSMDRLDQLVARSQREIEAHTHELGDTDSGRYFITEASHLACRTAAVGAEPVPD